MSAATQPFRLTGNATYRCIDCGEADHVFEQGYIVYDTDVRKGAPTNGRLCRSYCHHTNVCRRWIEVMRNGEWALCGQVEKVSNPQEIKGIKARVDHEQGVIKHRALSA